MSLDEVVLWLQRSLDRGIRRLRLGPAPPAERRRLLIVQIDGLAHSVLERGLAEGRLPFLGRLLAGQAHRIHSMSVGLPTSTPAFQLAAMYGVRGDIPGFHYHDKRRRADVYFPRGGDAAWVEQTQAGGRAGILEGGSAYGCVFTGGAVNSLFNFAELRRPTGRGVLRAVSGVVVLAWVVIKSLALTALELTRAFLRFLAEPVAESTRGWKWLALKVGISVWVRQLFTLAVSRDLYRGAPAVYVNYLDYDVFAHAYGPRHRRALRALRQVDRSIHQLWRVVRRVPEYRYDLYVLSDHGQAECVPYRQLSGGRPLERVLIEDFFGPAGARASAGTPSGRRWAHGIQAFRTARAPGLFQRFVNYLEHDFPWRLRDLPETEERDGVRVVTAGPNAFVYFLDSPEPIGIEEIARRFPGVTEGISRARGIGFVLARSEAGPLCVWQGKGYRLIRGEPGPFADRADAALVLDAIRELMAMASAGDLVIYGNDSPDGNVSFIPEIGAHAGPSPDELYTFIICPSRVKLASPIMDPTQLYPHFLAYQSG